MNNILRIIIIFQTVFVSFIESKSVFIEKNIQNHTEIQKLNVDSSILEDANLLVPELLEKYGYPSETHYVTTEDGYILSVHRIPRPGGRPVLLQHGILDSSATWIIMGVKTGLGYLLYDLGYDVWMGNNRGNRYSRNHTHSSISQSDFWNFSWHEMGVYDLPAMIDYILNESSHEKLHYIAHSQGTTTFWVMCAKRPEYNKKIFLMQALAPVAYMDDSKSPLLNLLIRFLNTAQALVGSIGFDEFSPSEEIIKKGSELVCTEKSIIQAICTNSLFLICGFNSEQLNKTMLPVLLAHSPAGGSVKQILHFGQIARSGNFAEYDYGIENYMRYGQYQPPNYDLDRITAPLIFHYAKNDWVSGWKVVEKFYEELKNPIIKMRYLVPNSKFNHLDFIWAIDARKLLYNRVANIMKRFDSNE